LSKKIVSRKKRIIKCKKIPRISEHLMLKKRKRRKMSMISAPVEKASSPRKIRLSLMKE
jgi:hypothetical protein